LDQLLTLLPAPVGVEVVFVTFDKADAREKVAAYRWYRLFWPTNRNLVNLLRNTGVALRVLRKERPDVIVSSGAAGAVPFFFLGRLIFGAKTIFVECIDRVTLPTLTARLVKRVTTTFIVQWQSQLPEYPNRILIGPSR
jgi:beta-1,4-N-acetylglucosaminyltransferase